MKANSWKVTYINPNYGYCKTQSFYSFDTKEEALNQKRHLKAHGFIKVSIRKKKGKTALSDFK